MNYPLGSEEAQRGEQLLRELVHEWRGKALEVLCAHEVVQTLRHKVEADAQMAAKLEAVHDVDDVVLALRVLQWGRCEQHCDTAFKTSRRMAYTHLARDMMKDLQLHLGLLMEAGLVADDLHCAHGLCLVVKALEHLAKRTLAKDAKNLKPVREVVVHVGFVVAALVVKAAVVLPYMAL